MRSTVTPHSEKLRQRAHAIWLERVAAGAPGDALSDWQQAEQELGPDPAPPDREEPQP